ncbi:MAG: RNA 2'-phosphotransferase [Clostridia bacterium]|nr:RNA 2'-phosphotransferase [Clostridia bacterium]
MRKTDTSRYIAYLLRHRPDAAGITLDEHGWAKVEDLLAGVNRTRSLTMEELEKIVRTDGKQRYSFSPDKTRIRANQGHSVQVDVEMTEVVPPTILYHGTATRFCDSIDSMGLIPGSRLYVHLSGDPETAVKVGKRHGKPLVYLVDAGRMAMDGFRFFRSENGVYLTKAVPPEYLSRDTNGPDLNPKEGQKPDTHGNPALSKNEQE